MFTRTKHQADVQFGHQYKYHNWQKALRIFANPNCLLVTIFTENGCLLIVKPLSTRRRALWNFAKSRWQLKSQIIVLAIFAVCGLQSVRAAEIKIKSHQMESIKLNQFYHLTANISAKLTIFISSFYRLTATECQKWKLIFGWRGFLLSYLLFKSLQKWRAASRIRY